MLAPARVRYPHNPSLPGRLCHHRPPPDSSQCQESLDILDRECEALGVPTAAHKRDGPTTCLVFLGIIIDTQLGELRLPADKLARLVTLLEEWGDRKACARKELESLIGLLNHACKVVRSGRSFLRRMIDMLHANGVSFLPPPSHLPMTEFTSDASGSWGCGAWHRPLAPAQVQWGPRSQALSIAQKELIPIILACDTWGSSWHGQQVLCHCDNQVVVACLRSRTSKDRGLMHLLRCLVFVEAHTQCFLHPTYIDTKAKLMLFHETICLSFCPRFQGWTRSHPQWLCHFWTSCWTRKLTGPHRSGANSSALL